MTNALVRVPALADAEVIRLVNGPEAFTPDGEFFLGPTEVRGFWVAAGFCAHGLAGAGGMGKLVAEWIVDGQPGPRRLGDGLAPLRRHTTPRPTTRSRARSRSTRPTTTSSTRATSGRPGGRCASRPRTRGSSSSAPPSARSRAGSGSTGSSRTRRRATSRCARAAGPDGSGRRRSAPSTAPAARAPRIFDETSFAKIEVAGAGRRRLPRAPLRQPGRARGRADHLHADAERRAAGSSATSPSRGSPRIASGSSPAPPSAATTSPGSASTRPEDGSRPVEDVTSALRLPRALGAGRAGDPAGGDDRRPRLPVHARARDRGRRGFRAWRSASPTSASSAGSSTARPSSGLALWDALWEAGRDARPRRRRLQGDRLAPAREGLPGLGRGHHSRRHALRGRPRLRRQARQGRVHRPRGAARSTGAGAPARLPRARGPALGRARLRAGADRRRARRPRDERRLRLHGRALDRLRVRAGRGTPQPGQPVEVEIFGEWVEGEVAPEPLFDPAGERLRG